MRRKTIWKQLLGFGLGFFIISEACAGSAPQVVNLDQGAIDTAIAGTMAAASTQTAQVVDLEETPSPTMTLTKTPSATPFPTFTVVVAKSLIYINKSTFCRAGPGNAYDKLFALKAGDAAMIVGRSKDAKYWIIRNPKHPNQLCWLSGRYANVSGFAGALPVFTAPPKPTPTKTRKPPTPKPPTPKVVPSFAVSYNGTVNCTGAQWYMQVNLTNTGKMDLEYLAFVMQDATTLQTFPLVESETFTNSNGCSSDSADTLPVGASHLVSLTPLDYDPAGHTFNLVIGACTKPAGEGSCAIASLTFTPPPPPTP